MAGEKEKKPLFLRGDVLFTAADATILAGLIRKVARPGMRAAEVGSWIGNGSTQVFISELAKVPDATLVCVDTWAGNNNVEYHQEAARQYDLFATFLANVEGAGVPVVPIKGDSAAVAGLLADGTFDLIFVDAGHDYGSALDDIRGWRKKLARGGILCGHDCELRVTPENRGLLEKSRDLDCIQIAGTAFLHIHPGVVLAVDEVFGGNAFLFGEHPITLDGRVDRSSIWSAGDPGDRT
jgi:predicted O-methyltransferase YrrM